MADVPAARSGEGQIRPVADAGLAMRRGVLFVIGFVIGALLFVMGGVNWAPAAPNCPGCSAVHPSMHRSRCNETAQGGSVCEVP